jgi:hypothetical protein
MTTAPTKEKRKEEKDNIFLDILYNLVVYIPVLVVSWLWEKISD